MKSQSYILRTLCPQVLEVLLFRGLMLSGSYVRLSNMVHNGTTTMGPTRVSLSALSKLCVNIKLNLGHNGPGGTWSPGNISTLLLHCTACSAQWLLFQFTSRLLTEAIWCCSDCVLLWSCNHTKSGPAAKMGAFPLHFSLSPRVFLHERLTQQRDSADLCFVSLRL